jgi:DNA-binding transcriptional ArsR family regulator
MRIHFTAEDLVLTRFSPQPAPLTELSLSVATVLRRDPVFGRISYDGPMTAFFRANGTGPLFMDPMSAVFDEGLDLVMSTPRAYVRSQLARFPLTPWSRDLFAFERPAWLALADALTAAHAQLIQPTWDQRCAGLRGDIAWRGQIIAEQGLRAALVTLVPGSRWQDGTLCSPARRDRDLDPGGRGLIFYPCVTWTGHVLYGTDSDGRLCLFYPAITPLPSIGRSSTSNPVGDLLGHTRAEILAMTLTAHSTGDLARKLHVSAATVSIHTKTLRSAGLLTTRRNGKAVLHTATPLGRRLLAG